MKKCFTIENKFYIFRKNQANTEKKITAFSDGDMTSIKKFDLKLKSILLKFRAYLVTILKALVGTVSLLYT